jgi:hypothetical protein
MRVLIAVAVSGALVVPGTIAIAKPSHPKPDLVVSGVSATMSGGSLAASATVTNKGKKKAGSSVAGVYLSSDTAYGAGDLLLGTLPTPKLKPKKKKTVSGTLSVPATVPPGTYYALVCADSGHKTKEKKEGNNCAASPGTMTIATGGTPGVPKVTVSWTSFFAEVSACGSPPNASGSCTVDVGAHVVLTATVLPHYAWLQWESPDPSHPCDGVSAVQSPTSATMTFDSLQHDAVCKANTVFTP